MNKMKNQHGMTFFGLLIVLGLIAFFVLLTLKVVPLYIENASIFKALDDLVGTPEIGKQGKKAMMSRLDGQFYIDDVKSITARDVVFKRESNTWQVSIDYEARASLFANIYVVAHFQKSVDVPR